jgi:nicotinamidase-related amidase
MQYDVALVCIITLVIVIGINATIYAMLYKGDAQKQIMLLRRASSKIKNPWSDEDHALAELARLTQKIKKHDSQ